MAATLHKLTAGDGYLYLIRQVAASDSTERGRNTLSEYYSAKGESPGHWVGTGLASLSDTGAREVSAHTLQEIWTVPKGSEVHEQQMAALFGEKLHPNAVDITNYTLGRGAQPAVAIEAAHLGRRFAVRTGETEFQRALHQKVIDELDRVARPMRVIGSRRGTKGVCARTVEVEICAWLHAESLRSA